MTKTEFLAALENGLAALPREDREKSLDYYGEMIDDRIEEGMSEQEAVEAVGSAEALAAGIVAEAMPEEPEGAPESAQTAEPEQRRGMGAWTIALLILGSPVWLPLLLAGAAVVAAVYVVMWAVVISLYAMTLSFAAGALSGVLGGIVHLVSGKPLPALVLVGLGLACAGFAILAFHLSNLTARGVLAVGKRIAQWIGGKVKNLGRRAAERVGGSGEKEEAV